MLDLTREMVEEQKLTALMVTHNMRDAIQIGNRLIMMNDGQIIYDVAGEEKKKLTVEDLLEKVCESQRRCLRKRPDAALQVTYGGKFRQIWGVTGKF